MYNLYIQYINTIIEKKYINGFYFKIYCIKTKYNFLLYLACNMYFTISSDKL